MNELFFIIPARGGSRGIPDKNLTSLISKPLIAYSIEVARKVSRNPRILVSTDSERIGRIAKRYGAEAPFLRPPELAQDHSTDLDWALHLISWLRENESKIPETMILLRPTTPIRDPKVLIKAIETFESRPLATSLRSVHMISESPYKMFQLNDDILNGDSYLHPYFQIQDTKDTVMESKEFYNLPRQNFPDAYVANGYIDILRSKIIEDTKTMYGDKILGFETERVIELDTLEDLHLLKLSLISQIT